jgi:hypothetical protein
LIATISVPEIPEEDEREDRKIWGRKMKRRAAKRVDMRAQE